MLVRKYGCDVAFTPMIVSRSFVDSLKARDNDFTICPGKVNASIMSFFSLLLIFYFSIV